MTGAQAIPSSLLRHRDLIEGALRAAIGNGTTELERLGRYVMGWEDTSGQPATTGGKRMRPALCLLGAEVAGGKPKDALPGAVAVELVHNFSLVHDEIQDKDAERHHRPTAWALVGEAQAINVGNFLYTRAIAALSAGPDHPERRLAALTVLNRAIGRMLEGQWQDISFEQRDDVTVDEYLEMVAGKTGALLGAPLEIGALLADAAPSTAAQLGHWGEQVGLAFQAHDDYLGTWGDPNITGKSASNDIARRKQTLPVIHALHDPDAAQIIRRAFAEDEPDVRAVIRALELSGADRLCREEARRHAAEATNLLSTMDVSDDTRRDLAAVADFIVARDF